ncbi:MAG TPA: hypothetical protein VHL52_07730, partial [Acidimicrobiia bacterium]|nr:hypothetical protein [Acidimicrobiia bacterium]
AKSMSCPPASATTAVELSAAAIVFTAGAALLYRPLFISEEPPGPVAAQTDVHNSVVATENRPLVAMSSRRSTSGY